MELVALINTLQARAKRGTVEEHNESMQESLIELSENLKNTALGEICKEYTHCFSCNGWGGHGPGGFWFRFLMIFGAFTKPCDWLVLFGPKGICCIDTNDLSIIHHYDANEITKIKADKIDGSSIIVCFDTYIRNLVLVFGDQLSAQRPADVMKKTILNRER